MPTFGTKNKTANAKQNGLVGIVMVVISLWCHDPKKLFLVIDKPGEKMTEKNQSVTVNHEHLIGSCNGREGRRDDNDYWFPWLVHVSLPLRLIRRQLGGLGGLSTGMSSRRRGPVALRP